MSVIAIRVIRKFTAALILIIALANALSYGGPEQLSELENGHAQISEQSAALTSPDAAHTDGHCNDGACHDCHIGHCGFLISLAVSLLSPVAQTTLSFPTDDTCVAALVSEVTRPPLA